jgi:EAL domain-containing protein (putative c-di-GMP-specific phosphodiesterase class I)
VTFAHGIDATLIAEGVETTEQLGALDLLGVPLAQGYYLGRPETLDG